MGFNDFDKSFLYVVRTKWDSSDKNVIINGLSKPCGGCMDCIDEYKIKYVVYTLDQVKNSKETFGVLVL